METSRDRKQEGRREQGGVEMLQGPQFGSGLTTGADIAFSEENPHGEGMNRETMTR